MSPNRSHRVRRNYFLAWILILILVRFAVKILLVLADIFGDVEKETAMTMGVTMQDLHIKEVLCL